MIAYDARPATMAELRTAVRRLADAHSLPVLTRARLVASVAPLARAGLARGRPVELRARRCPSAGPADGGDGGDGDGNGDSGDGGGNTARGVLTVTLTPAAFPDGPDSPDDPGAHDAGTGTEAALPLAPEFGADGAAVWRLPLHTTSARFPAPQRHPDSTTHRTADGSTGNGADAGDDGSAAEEELRTALAELDTLRATHRRLNDELAATNSGVLALYVQLEERDEQLRRAHGQMLRELEDALRPAPPPVPGVELSVHYAPADTDAPTGGDLYDWFTLPDGTVHITVVDALGHGVRSTGSALNVTHTVRTLALEGHDPRNIVERAGQVLNGIDPELMATVLLVRLDPATGELLLANGSHPPALVVREDGGTAYLEAGGRGIGFPMPGSEELVRTRLVPGDLLVLYTDGLTESRRDPVEGERLLAAAAARNARLPIGELPGTLAEEMHTEVLHQDDTLALAVRLTGGAATGAAPARRGPSDTAR